MHHLLFIVETIPDKLLYERLGLVYLKKMGCKIDILYVASVSRKEYYKKTKYKNQKNFIDGKNKLEIINYLKKKIKKSTIVFTIYRQNTNTFFIYEYLKNNKVKIALIGREAVLQKRKDFKDILIILITSPLLFFKLLFKKFFYIDTNKLNYDYIFTSGKLLEKKFKKNGRIIKIHHYDLDFFLNAKKFKKKKKYALFISPATLNPDIYDNNPGYKIKNILNFKNNKYFQNIKVFLNSLKNITKFDILVAKHPKDNFDLEKKINFKCYKNITPELVKNSEFVICFDSSAFQFAILSRKPVIFLTSNNFPKLVKDDILTRCNFFDKSPMNIENKLNINELKNNLRIDNKKYENYKNLYISNANNKDKNKKSCEIIYEFIKNI